MMVHDVARDRGIPWVFPSIFVFSGIHQRMVLIRFRDRFVDSAAVTAAGHLVAKHERVGEREIDSYALVLIQAGDGFYADAQVGRCAVSAGDLLVLRPGVVQDYGPEPGGQWTERFVVFHGAVFDQLHVDGVIDAAQPVWRVGLDPDLIAGFAELDRRLRSPGVDQLWCVARTHVLVVEAARRAAHRDGDFVAAARAAVEEDLAGTLRLSAIAARFGLSEQVFRKRFARAAGLPPARWRQQRRIAQARHLLLTTSEPLASIASRLGWCDVFFFARQFKQATGQAPGAFRAAFRGIPEVVPTSLKSENEKIRMRRHSPSKRR